MANDSYYRLDDDDKMHMSWDLLYKGVELMQRMATQPQRQTASIDLHALYVFSWGQFVILYGQFKHTLASSSDLLVTEKPKTNRSNLWKTMIGTTYSCFYRFIYTFVREYSLRCLVFCRLRRNNKYTFHSTLGVSPCGQDPWREWLIFQNV